MSYNSKIEKGVVSNPVATSYCVNCMVSCGIGCGGCDINCVLVCGACDGTCVGGCGYGCGSCGAACSMNCTGRCELNVGITSIGITL